ncbi:hypothetical protein JMJ56_16930 [Belnapia sp. T18]|uniref:DUF4412 domain-containing protein n=1 Tax=Belnapia arida TaxID=2804533 RepID=A0ABS1U6C8_9PROT|nr:hypothetical protein [Belnapia arida]MBL6079705.1 hypothetical protein [Belnapia arida]
MQDAAAIPASMKNAPRQTNAGTRPSRRIRFSKAAHGADNWQAEYSLSKHLPLQTIGVFCRLTYQSARRISLFILGLKTVRLPLARSMITAFVAILAVPPALAQERPPAMPARDVTVTYKVDETPPTVDTVAWLASEGRIRTDGRSLINRVAHIIDTRSGNVVVLVDADRTYHDLGRMAAVMTQDIVLIRLDRKITREGVDTVAGHACTVWRIETDDGNDPDEARRACITADGVPLRLIEGSGADASTLYVATRVTYGPQDPARFQRPADYRPIGAVPAAPRR